MADHRRLLFDTIVVLSILVFGPHSLRPQFTCNAENRSCSLATPRPACPAFPIEPVIVRDLLDKGLEANWGPCSWTGHSIPRRRKSGDRRFWKRPSLKLKLP